MTSALTTGWSKLVLSLKHWLPGTQPFRCAATSPVPAPSNTVDWLGMSWDLMKTHAGFNVKEVLPEERGRAYYTH